MTLSHVDILKTHIDILSFSISDAIVSQVLDELGLQLTDQLSGNSLQKDPNLPYPLNG